MTTSGVPATHQRLREVKDLVDSCGLEIFEFLTSGKGHIRVRCTVQNAEKAGLNPRPLRVFVLSSTPGDQRSDMNPRSEMKRFYREVFPEPLLASKLKEKLPEFKHVAAVAPPVTEEVTPELVEETKPVEPEQASPDIFAESAALINRIQTEQTWVKSDNIQLEAPKPAGPSLPPPVETTPERRMPVYLTTREQLLLREMLAAFLASKGSATS